MYQQIKSSPASVNQKLRDLCADGFAQRTADDRFQFGPNSPELKAQIAALNTAYQKRRIKVIESIFSKSTDDLRNFADAFKIRKEKE